MLVLGSHPPQSSTYGQSQATGGLKRSILFLVHREKGFSPLMLPVTVRPQVQYFYLLDMPLFHLFTFYLSKRKKRLK